MARGRAVEQREVIALGAGLTLAATLASFTTLVDGWERRSIDLRFELAPRAAAPLHRNIAFVDIDDGALGVGGRWPWPRERLALALHEIARTGARTVALDLLLVEPEGTRDGRAGPGDLALAEALRAALAALTAERGALPPLDEAVAALQPADSSLRLARRDVELLSSIHAQELAWRALAPWLLPANATADCAWCRRAGMHATARCCSSGSRRRVPISGCRRTPSA